MRTSLLLALSLVAAFSLPHPAFSASFPLPSVRWTRGVGVLKLQIAPGAGSHLSGPPLRVVLSDGFFTVRLNDAGAPKQGPAKLKLPLAAKEGSEGWSLKIDGGACADAGDSCVPFHVELRIPRRGRMKGGAEGEAGGLAPAAWGLEPVAEEVTKPRLPNPGQRTFLVGGQRQLAPGPQRWFSTTAEGDEQRAFQRAQELGWPLLVDFYGTWCPPCNRLRDEFLEAPEHAAELSELVLLRADADHEGSFPLKDRYRIGGYPTVLLLASDGALLDRTVGFSGAEDFGSWLAKARGQESVGELKARAAAETDPAEASHLWMAVVERLVAKGDAADDAWELLGEHGPPLYAAGDIDALRLALELGWKRDPAIVEPIAERLFGLEQQVGRAASAASTAIRLLGAQEPPLDSTALQQRAVERILPELSSPEGFSVAAGASSISAELPPATSDQLEDWATGAWYAAAWVQPERRRELLALGALRMAACVQRGGPAAGGGVVTLPAAFLDPDGRERLVEQEGRVHDLLDLLEEAELWAVAAPLYDVLLERFPETFTWSYRYARFLQQQGQEDAALAAARQAYDASYGDNRLRASARLATYLRDGGQREAALAVLAEALSAGAPSQEHVRTHRYRERLETLQEELANPEATPEDGR